MNKSKQNVRGEVQVRLIDEKGALTEVMALPKVTKTEQEWKVRLDDQQYQVARTEGTERAFCGIFHDNHKNGFYFCVGCGLPLFRSQAKFESGTGWPSFFAPVAPENIIAQADHRYGMSRTEIHCPRCESHFGHVFPDGPAPTGLRYCLNSAAMLFQEEPLRAPQTAYFAAGCFWGVEESFRNLPGVLSTKVGYMGGKTKNPTYQTVCHHDTGHAEVVKVEFDPGVISYDQLLINFWEIHDPTTLNRQGPDVGDQYRSALFFSVPSQETLARASVARLASAGLVRGQIVTQIELAPPFYLAEEYHQQYVKKHRGAGCALPHH